MNKEHRGIIPGGEMVTRGNMFDVFSSLLQSDIPWSKGEILFKAISKALKQGEQPQGKFKQGE